MYKSLPHCLHSFIFLCFVGHWVGGLDLNFQNTCTALPSLHSPIPYLPLPDALCPLILSCPVQTSTLERGLRLGWRLGGWCICRKKKTYIFDKELKWEIRMDYNVLGRPLNFSPPFKKFFFKCPVGKHWVVNRGVSLDFYLTCIIWLKRGKSSSCEVGSALWESV